ncbi:BLUF domain-containing protein [Marinibactrum halimedae]|uniref:BLUF domain-containing protein n=1 Tax=Marinibactrum halimedae TaxID=1444977 RepID=A0AA37WP76_9GAMM|nr:BLUF domain-containing protein [Marinibactrum halimedae]MCD9459301.1 BLUF domain-containing protein [Marinibactrum halimedae]GLS25807.1 hypothetical protein GCM10007877_15210 [Marinibactrum halimedae]
MFLTRLVYASKKSPKFCSSDIDDILETARKHNGSLGITGLLCFNRQYFLQALEGPRSAINSTYYRITQDKRHSDMLILSYEEIRERNYGSWNMGYVPESSLTAPQTLKYSIGSEFDPFSMSSKSACMLLNDLSKTVPII